MNTNMHKSPLQVEELTDAVCREYLPELEHAVKAMQSLVHPELYQQGRGKPASQLISENHGKGLDPYIPDFVLAKIKKAVRS